MRFANPFSTLYRHRDLVVQFTRREVELRHKGSRLGHLWAILRPMSLFAIYIFVFDLLLGGKYGTIAGETSSDFAVAMFLSLSLSNIVVETIGASPLMIVNQPNFVKKVVFPLEIIPLSSVATSVYHSLLSVLIALAIAPFTHQGISWAGAAALPLLVLPLALIGLGLSWTLAAVGVFVRDVNQLVPFASNAIVYASAVFYAPARIQSVPLAWAILRLNPLLVLFDQARRIVLWHLAPNFGALAYAYLAALAIVVFGYALFATLRPYFAEVI
jgi:lipopolysaccharide transport system permease protein